MKTVLLTFAVALALAPHASAHDVRGPNGGRVADAGPWHMELVAKQKTIDVYLSDTNDKPVPLDGFKGLAILTVGGKAQRIPLALAEGARLSGTSDVALPRNPKGAIQVTAPDGKTATGRYK